VVLLAALTHRYPARVEPLDHLMSMACSTRQCKPLTKTLWTGVKTTNSSGLLIHSMFFQQPKGELQNSMVLSFTSRCSGAQLLHSTTGLCCQHGRGGKERGCTGTHHISASPEGLLIPAYELEEK